MDYNQLINIIIFIVFFNLETLNYQILSKSNIFIYMIYVTLKLKDELYYNYYHILGN